MGATKRPSYRVVAIEGRKPRDGRSLEILGFYDPLTDPATVKIEAERVRAWIGKGAQPSDTVVRLLRQVGLDEKGQASEEASKPRAQKAPAKSAARPPAVRTKASARAESKATAEDQAAPEASTAGASETTGPAAASAAAPEPDAEAAPKAGAEAAPGGDGGASA